MRSSLFYILVAIVAPINLLTAEKVISILDIGQPTPLRFAKEHMELSMDREGLKVMAPNFWQAGWQVINPVLSQLVANEEKPLVLVARGFSANEKLVLRLRFVSEDWKRADIYLIPLDSMDSVDFKKLSATTPIGQPEKQDNGGLNFNEQLGAIQFLFAGEGNQPIELQLKELQLP